MKESIRNYFGKELINKAATDDFIIFNADTKSCSIENFGDFYPNRSFTFGIAEQNLLAAAAGAALCGERVFLATFAVFASMRACEQLRTFICLPKLDVVVLASHGGLQTGADGATHISVEDLSILRSIPNLTIVEPSDVIAAKRLLDCVLNYHGPLYIRFPKSPTPIIHNDNYNMQIGKANIIKTGHDATIITCGWILSRVIEAADILAKEGFEISVVEMHTIKPIDQDAIINASRTTGAIVTVEDNSILGGLGSAVSEIVCSSDYLVPVKRIGILDCFGESGEPDLLYEKNKMTVADIVSAVKDSIRVKEKNT